MDESNQLSNLIALLALIAAIVAAFLAYPSFRQARAEKGIDHFRQVRKHLVKDRAELVKAARDLFLGGYFIPGTNLLTRIDWLLDEPVELDRVLVSYHPAERTPAVNGQAKQIHAPIAGAGCRRTRR
jgi:hypothetical protein